MSQTDDHIVDVPGGVLSFKDNKHRVEIARFNSLKYLTNFEQKDYVLPALDTLMFDGLTGLEKESRGVSALSFQEQLGIQAVVRFDGSRPVVVASDVERRLRQGLLGDWTETLSNHHDTVQNIIQSTGAIYDPTKPNLNPATVFYLGNNFILTNRHVLQIYGKLRRDNNRWVAAIGPNVRVSFSDNPLENASDGIAIKQLEYVSPNVINPLKIDPNREDICILSLEDDLSGILTKAQLEENNQALLPTIERDVFMVGFPGRYAPTNRKYKDIARMFRHMWNRKTISVGRISVPLGKVHNDPPAGSNKRPYSFEHDCSTLNGSSGSPVCNFGANSAGTLIGVHRGGQIESKNYANAVDILSNRLGNFS